MFTHAGAINWFVVNDAIKNLRYLPKRFCNHDIKINLKVIVEQLKKPTVYITIPTVSTSNGVLDS